MCDPTRLWYSTLISNFSAPNTLTFNLRSTKTERPLIPVRNRIYSFRISTKFAVDVPTSAPSRSKKANLT